MLLEPPARPEIAAPVGDDPSPDRTAPALPPDLRPMARATDDPRALRVLAQMLLGRHRSIDDTDAVVDLPRARIAALASVRRPGTAAGHVARELVTRAVAPPRPRVA